MRIRNLIAVAITAGLIISPVYAKKDKSKHLPPGLQKKAAQGKPLPPGWQKKLARGSHLDRTVYQQSHVVVPLDSKGLITISVGGKLLRLHKATREIIDILR